MANTRIKDISTAATTLNSDDFIAVDGSTAGTRKMAKADLINEVSSGVSGTYLEESNNLSDVASLDTSKLNMEIPDVGSAGNEVSLNSMLGTMAFQDADGVSAAKLEVESTTGTATTQALTVTDGSSTNFVVQEDGNVGIGNNSPSSYHPSADDLVVGDTSGHRGMTIVSGSGNSGSIYFADGTSGDALYRGYIGYNQGSNLLNFGTAATTQWQINNSGNLVAYAAGVGIDFGSTTTGVNTPTVESGLLDDYEEGRLVVTATPAASGTMTVDTGNDNLSYTKVGRKVSITGVMVLSSVSSPVGNYITVPLPFEVANEYKGSANASGSCFIYNAAGNSGDYSILALEGQTYFRIYKNTAASSVATAADFSGDEIIYIGLTYFAA